MERAIIRPPVRLSQKDHSSYNFREAGCAITAAIMAAALSDRRMYNIHSFDGQVNGVDIWSPAGNNSVNYNWMTVNGWSFSRDYSIANYKGEAAQVNYLKRYIDSGICPICFSPAEGGGGHWMLVYGYNTGSTYSSILVYDPADGGDKTLAAGMAYSGTSANVTQIRAQQTIG